jgi:hypothetical protein
VKMKIKVKVKGIIYLFIKDRKAALSQGRCFSSLLFSAAAAAVCCLQSEGRSVPLIYPALYTILFCSALLYFALLYYMK